MKIRHMLFLSLAAATCYGLLVKPCSGSANTGRQATRGTAQADRLVLLDGTALDDTVAAIDPGGAVRTKGSGAPIELDGLRRIERPGPAAPAQAAPCEVYLAGGGVLRAQDAAFDGRQFSVTWAYGGPTALPLAAVRALLLGRAPAGDAGALAPEFAAALARDELPRDELFAAADQALQVVRGALQKVSPQEVRFIWNDAERQVQRARVYGVVLARRGAPPDRAGQCLIRLADGSSLWATVAGMKGRRLSVGIPGGADLVLPWDAVRRIEVRSTRMVFLSDLDPVEVRQEPLVTYAGPWRRDRNVLGGPLVLAETAYEKGLGVHSRTCLVYQVGGRYDVFAATIGIDASAAGRGDCVFSVAADDKELFRKRVRGTDPPVPVRLPVRGAGRLALAVDWGEDLDLADLADWCDARLLKESGGP